MDKKVILISGASSGFGYEVASRLLDTGNWTVYAAARRIDKMLPLKEKGAVLLEMDVTCDDAVSQGVSQMLELEHRIDVLFANAGYGSYGMVEEVSMDEIQYQYDVNVFGVARQIKAVLPQMRKQRSGRIIVTASVVSNISTMGLGWYASTKHAIKGMVTALRQEVRDFGIDVVRIEPGAVKTGFDTIALDKLQAVDHHEDYKLLVSGVDAMLRDMYAKCPGPDSTVMAIITAISAKNPRSVYRTTFDSRVLPHVVGTLPEKIYDATIIGRVLKDMK